ncbi:hypothetical protein UFOVP273_58 [uncultured Caudovirales phage]|uniref:Uncharacterized protein n=1 Tax=uncultured Caudovirales phage TaxID=2100421 RepID=A0A6J5LIM6_9CAUD|nr:hypothetical protein UFOVP273_58 [uncultured Caudovirales phage]
MFPDAVDLIFKAQIALQAAQAGDPRFETLVEKLMERCSLSADQVLNNLIQLSQGNVSI